MAFPAFPAAVGRAVLLFVVLGCMVLPASTRGVISSEDEVVKPCSAAASCSECMALPGCEYCIKHEWVDPILGMPFRFAANRTSLGAPMVVVETGDTTTSNTDHQSAKSSNADGDRFKEQRPATGKTQSTLLRPNHGRRLHAERPHAVTTAASTQGKCMTEAEFKVSSRNGKCMSWADSPCDCEENFGVGSCPDPRKRGPIGLVVFAFVVAASIVSCLVHMQASFSGLCARKRRGKAS